MKNLKSIIVMALAASLIMSSCTKDLGVIVGTGNVITETLDLDQFSKIRMDGADNVTITYGTEQEVKAIGHPNIIDRIKTEVENDTWYMELERGTYGNYNLRYEITIPAIQSINSNGASNIIIEDFIKQEDLSLKISGTGNFEGFNMPLENCTIDISGLGNCEVNVEQRLDVTISGSGQVFYKGNPSVVKNISGLGSIKKVD